MAEAAGATALNGQHCQAQAVLYRQDVAVGAAAQGVAVHLRRRGRVPSMWPKTALSLKPAPRTGGWETLRAFQVPAKGAVGMAASITRGSARSL